MSFKLYSELADERVTFREFRLIWKVAESQECERAGDFPEETSEYGYGAKPAPVDSAETILKIVDDPSWETVAWEQSRLRGGASDFEGIERAVENVEEYQEEVPKNNEI